ncbi:MAG TPA: translation initiation factor IF-2 subunit gamma [Candidatus Woesearchaeota archaeon]|nr:translation initiation factor IF-2 subunit gamma [Candidatus Woesearchaeota archaeon]
MAKKKQADDVQPEISIGMIGHVDHGKTTLVKALSGKWADTHSEEIKRGITIRLGYADVSFYKCKKCKEPECYSTQKKCPVCGSPTEFLRKVSLVDAPGHESLMATMLCSTNIMDGAILLISAKEKCPQPQTQEHLMALEISGVKNIVVVQNKVDLVDEVAAKKNFSEIREFLSTTKFKDAPIIPMSALHSINVDVLIQTLQNKMPTPKRDTSNDPLMFVARSFDINKPGSPIEKWKGGVLGGALKQGSLKVGDDAVILPGYEVEERNSKVWKPLDIKIKSIIAGGVNLKEVVPGGSMAVMTELDPFVVKSDKLVGSVVGKKGKMPPVWYNFSLDIHLLERIVGAKDKLVVEPIKKGEFLMMNVNSAATVGIVQELSKNSIKCALKRPVCAEVGSRVALSRRIGQRWRLIGYGEIKKD